MLHPTSGVPLLALCSSGQDRTGQDILHPSCIPHLSTYAVLPELSVQTLHIPAVRCASVQEKCRDACGQRVNPACCWELVPRAPVATTAHRLPSIPDGVSCSLETAPSSNSAPLTPARKHLAGALLSAFGSVQLLLHQCSLRPEPLGPVGAMLPCNTHAFD